MADRKPNLYRWDKFSKPRVYSRSQQVTTKNDIQDWIQKVEEASDNAAAAAFGGKPTKRAARAEAKYRAEDVQLYDAAYSEAQDLLQQWVSDKIVLEDNDLDYEPDPIPHRSHNKKTSADIKREWDQLVLANDEEYGTENLLSPTPASQRSKEMYSRLLEDDVDTTVDGILQKMLDKDFVSNHVTQDLGLEDDIKRKQADPTTRMKLRHQQVKENREKREAERRRHIQESQAKKEAQLNARKMINREAAEKEAQRKREESEIQREMAKIRKEMAEEQKKAEEKKKIERLEKEKKDLQAEAELERKRLLEEEARKILSQEDIDRQRKIAMKIQEAESKNTRVRLRMLHKYFGEWYRTVADRRIQLGKARAMSDWKLLLRTWRAWRAYTVTQNSEKDTQRHVEEVKDRQRKQIWAEQHYRNSLLRRCLAAWILHISLERKQRELTSEQNRTKNKMASFLEAATSGSLWAQGEGNLRKSLSLDNVNRAPSQESARQRVDDMFSQPVRQRRGSSSARSAASTSRSDTSDKSASPAVKKPLQAWQITRKHIQLTKEEMANLSKQGQQQGQNEDQIEGSDTGRSDGSKLSTGRSPKKPWEKKFVVNTTEHRTAAQAKILEQQQNQIKEQQRLIEELTYLQKQQMLQTQLTQQQLIQHQLGGAPHPAANLAANPSKLDKHIKELQASLVRQVTRMATSDTGSAAGNSAEIETDSIKDEFVTHRSDNTSASALVQVKTPSRTTLTSNAVNQLNDGKAEVSSVHDKKGSKTTRSDVSQTTAGSSTARTTSSSSSKHIKFLHSMEERAAERARLKAEREEKRRKVEEERLARLAAEAEEARLKEEEEKRERQEMYRERKRQEREREAEKQRELVRIRTLHTSAELHYQRSLLKFRGWRPWRCLMEITHNRQVVAEEHYRTTLLRKVLLSWHENVREEVEHKEGLADHMFRYQLIRRCFSNWQRVGECVAIQEQKAMRFYTTRLRSRIFLAWRDLTEEEKIAMWHKERKAREHSTYRIKKSAFSALRRFPKVRREDEARERRRLEMRRKVASMLTDYDGHEKHVHASNESDVSDFFDR